MGWRERTLELQRGTGKRRCSGIFLQELHMITHLGRSSSDIDPKQAAHENRILACLQKRGTMRENEVKLYTASTRRVGREIHDRAVRSLVDKGLIRKLTTTRANSFILELTGKLLEPELSSRSAAMVTKSGESKIMPGTFAH